jgi:magnesium chelatase family protein
VERKELMGPPTEPTSATVRERVCAAREMQASRFGSRLVTNASASRKLLEPRLEMTAEARHELTLAFDGMRLSGRGLDRALKMARTVADLHGAAKIELGHMVQALSLRVPDSGERAA